MNKPKQSPLPPTSVTKGVDESSVGWKLFTAFVNNPEATITEDELRSYAINELKISEDDMPQELKDNLPVILLAFMNMWSGWHFKKEFLDGKIERNHYFARFHKFMFHKMEATVKTTFNAALKQISGQLKAIEDERKDLEFAPYSILIECPPAMLNTIVFSNLGDDIIMKQHQGNKWHDLSIVQLLNWPYVEVMFRNEDISFVRRQATEFMRYLNFSPHESVEYDGHVVEYAEEQTLYQRNNRQCFSYNFLEKYLKMYIQTLNSSYPELTKSKLDEISAIFTQFLEDVKFMGVNNSIPTNTCIRFRLSKASFIRNKKLKNPYCSSGETRVGYCEVITPKVELVLIHCKAEQVLDADHITFKYIEKLKNKTEEIIMPFVEYKCTFCLIEFKEPNAKRGILNHLQIVHRMEPHVRCTVCKKQFDVLNLAMCRWRHKCLVSILSK